MDDERIIALYWQRDETAISATAEKYGAYCGSIARRVLSDAGDVEECLNDTWLHAWNAIPPHRPRRFGVFLGKLTRELAVDRYRLSHRSKRGSGEYTLALEELSDVISAPAAAPEDQLLLEELGAAISAFLRTQPALAAQLFIRRYYHLEPVKQLAEDFGIGESKAKVILFRTRNRLHIFLEKEGYL